MESYIDEINGQKLPNLRKAESLIVYADATPLREPPDKLIPDLVCVIVDETYDIAFVVESESDLARCLLEEDRRMKLWLIVPNAAQYT
jgi:hypothetical protein